MKIGDRYSLVFAHLKTLFPDAETELHYQNAYQLLVAVVLSAQCTDERVNKVTPALFQKFPNPKALGEASAQTVFEYIKSISYPNNKSKYLVSLGKKLTEEFGGNVPMSVAELVTLPGVGRKTAHVITSVLDNQPNMAVDTHVFRVSNRLGLTRGAKNVLQAEKQLVKHLPPDEIHQAHHLLILFGRRICKARNPLCTPCALKEICRFYAVTQKSLSKSSNG